VVVAAGDRGLVDASDRRGVMMAGWSGGRIRPSMRVTRSGALIEREREREGRDREHGRGRHAHGPNHPRHSSNSIIGPRSAPVLRVLRRRC
jgi:hypothetical protein